MFSKKLSFRIIRGSVALAVVTLVLIPATLARASTPASSALLGSSVSSPADLAAKTSQFGRLHVVRVYLPGLPPTDAWSTGLAGANASADVVSFKARPGRDHLGRRRRRSRELLRHGAHHRTAHLLRLLARARGSTSPRASSAWRTT